MTTYTETELREQLAREGHDPADIDVVVDQLVGAGLSLPQPDEGWVFTTEEVAVGSLQLRYGGRS